MVLRERPSSSHSASQNASSSRESASLQLEALGAALVREQPALRLDEIAARGVGEAADAVGSDDAVARDHDRQAVVAAGLADRSRRHPQPPRERAVGERLAARNLAQRVP